MWPPRIPAPAEDRERVIHPDAGEWVTLCRGNFTRLANATSPVVLGLSLRELRAAARKLAGLPQDQPLIVVGHQVGLSHPGVWFKQVVACQLAQCLGGKACLVSIDTDAPKDLSFRFHGGAADLAEDSKWQRSAWSGAIASVSTAHLARTQESVARAMGPAYEQTLLPAFFRSMALHAPGAEGLTEQLANSLAQVDRGLGLSLDRVVSSMLWNSPPCLAMVHDIMARPASFAAAYNLALEEYRRERQTSTGGQPWPRLQILPDSVETPFWLDDLSAETRSRAVLERGPGGWRLRIDRDTFTFRQTAGWEPVRRLAAFLSESQARLVPRALCTTLMLRLLLADVFIHGAGGADYDQVTDRVMRIWYAIEPPAVGMASATLYLPAAAGLRRLDLHRVLLEERRRQHGWGDPRKRRMAEEIAAAPRASDARRSLFEKMHRYLVAAAQSPERLRQHQQYQDDLDLARRQRDLHDRTHFYLLQTRERLQSLMAPLGF
jgi:hypothetical protein